MNTPFRPSARLKDAYKTFCRIAKEEGVPFAADRNSRFVGLPENSRRVLFILEYINHTATVSALVEEQRLNGICPSQIDTTTGPTGIQTANLPPPPVSYSSKNPSFPAPSNGVIPSIPSSRFQAIDGESGPIPTFEAPKSSSPENSGKQTASIAKPIGTPYGPTRLAAPDNKPVVHMETFKKSVFLKNARAGEPYDEPLIVDGLKDARVSGQTDCGLAYDETAGHLRGTPSVPGDFVIRFSGLINGRRADITANLAVIPDPKTLWKNIPSNPDGAFPKPDEDFGIIDSELFCVAASKRGRSHARDGGYRDDDFGLLAINGWHIAAVADGAGSAKLSRRGSKVAVDSVLADLPALLSEHMDAVRLGPIISGHVQGRAEATGQIRNMLYQSVATAAFQAAKAIEDESNALGEKASALSTTLIVCIARKFADGWFFAGFSVGDGGAAVIDVDDGDLSTLTLPDSGEFAGQTRFLHRSEFAGGFDEIAKRIFFCVRPKFTAMALMTDGISDPKLPTDTVFADAGKWTEFWRDDLAKSVNFSRDNPELRAQLLAWLDFWSPGNHDDRTLAVLVS